jgi:hypothetical protein
MQSVPRAQRARIKIITTVLEVQLSSVGVERVFSRLRLILDATQEGVLHDAITIHLFDAINSKHHDAC